MEKGLRRLRAVAAAAVIAFVAVTPGRADTSGDLDEASRAYVAGDYETAFSIYMPLAERRDSVAQTHLGLMYDYGLGVPQDDAEAVRWFRMAAEQGVAFAQEKLGAMYAVGRGVPQDNVLAHMWLNLAGAQGAEDARTLRDRIAEAMTPAEIAEAQRLAREWVAGR